MSFFFVKNTETTPFAFIVSTLHRCLVHANTAVLFGVFMLWVN